MNTTHKTSDNASEFTNLFYFYKMQFTKLHTVCSKCGILIGKVLFKYQGGRVSTRAGVLNLFHQRTPCVPVQLFAYPQAINYLNWHTHNTTICITLCYNLHTLELFVYPMELFAYPQGSSTTG